MFKKIVQIMYSTRKANLLSSIVQSAQLPTVRPKNTHCLHIAYIQQPLLSFTYKCSHSSYLRPDSHAWRPRFMAICVHRTLEYINVSTILSFVTFYAFIVLSFGFML